MQGNDPHRLLRAAGFTLLIVAASFVRAAGDTTGATFSADGHTAAGLALRAAGWPDLPGFTTADHRQAFTLLRSWCAARAAGKGAVRPTAAPMTVPMDGVCSAALAHERPPDQRQALDFFVSLFKPWGVGSPAGHGFLTGYYEPEVSGSPVRAPGFAAPVLARPDDLVSLAPGEKFFPDEQAGVDTPLSGARRRPDGLLEAYPTRAAIQAGALGSRARPLVWLRDAVEVFFIHVQGSARVRLPDGTRFRLAYDGRNGHPYTSIGRLLAQSGRVPAAGQTLAGLKGWLRAHEAEASAVMERNRSYIFFKRLPDTDAATGPVGAAGVPLEPLGSIAVDRQIWSYGLPFWIDASALPWRSRHAEPFRRLTVALDTGSAIVGPARADIFFGSGEAAGERAGDIRHPADFYVLLPRDFRPS